MIALVTSIGVLPALLGGLYPALVLSGFRPALGLRLNTGSHTGARVRMGLVVVQFAMAAFLVVSSVAVHRQVVYMDTIDRGYVSGNTITFGGHNREAIARLPLLRDLLVKDPRVDGVAITTSAPGSWLFEGQVSWASGMEARPVKLLGGNRDFIEVFRMRLLAGRTTTSYPEDASVCLINRSTLTEMGLSSPEEALGRSLQWEFQKSSWSWRDDGRVATIIGVVDDFQWESVWQPIMPTILYTSPPGGETAISVRLNEHDLPGAVDFVKASWSQVIPELPFKYEFVNDRIHSRHQTQRLQRGLIAGFATIAVLLTAVGLFSLSTLLSQQRTRSIAIRKVLGASLTSLLHLMTRELTWLVVVGNLIAIPVTYLVTNWWLSEFAYRIDVSPWTYWITGLVTIIGAWCTVGYQTLRVVLTDPALALRHE